MSANSSGNGHRLKTISPSRSHEGIFGVLRGQISKGWERWPNGWTNLDQIVGHIFTWLCEWTHVEKHWPCETPGEHFNPRLIRGNIWDFRGKHLIESLDMIDLQKQNYIFYTKIKSIH